MLIRGNVTKLGFLIYSTNMVTKYAVNMEEMTETQDIVND